MASGRVDISILVVDDDPTCLSIVAGILQRFNHHVVAMKNPLDALSTLRTKSESFDLILTDVHMPQMSGLELLNHVEQEFKLPVVLMSADSDKVIMLKGLANGAAFFLVKPIGPQNLERLWQYAVSGTTSNPFDMYPLSRRASSTLTFEENTNNNNKNKNNDVVNFASLMDGREGPDGKTLSGNSSLKRTKVDEIQMKMDSGNGRKKPKLIWTTSLHNQFLEAVNKIGLDKAVPKKILECMNVPGLKRENVASHLQKYRIFLKRISEASNSMQHGVPNNWNERPFRSSFVLNEITFLTNNLQQQYQQLMSKSKGKGKGQNSTQENSSGDNPNKNENCTTNNTQLFSVQGTQETHGTSMFNDKPISESEQQGFPSGFGIEGTSCNGVRNNESMVGNLQSTTNNYVGLRITTNGELIGTLKDTPVVGNGNCNHLLLNDSNDSAPVETLSQDDVVENPIYSSWDEPLLFGMDNDNMNLYISSLLDDNPVQQQEAFFGVSQEPMASHDFPSDDCGQVHNDDIQVNQELFGNDFPFGSYDMPSDGPGSFEGLDQGILGSDDVFFNDNYYMEDYGHEILANFDQDGLLPDFMNFN